MSLAEKKANIINLNPIRSDEQSYGGFNLVQTKWDMLDQKKNTALSNEDIEDAIAKPFDLKEHEKNEQKAISRETSEQIA